MKGTKSYMKIISMVFLKKFFYRAHAPFWAQKTLDLLSGFFLILYSKRDQKVHENYNNDFSEKNVFLGNRTIFGHKMKRPHNSGSALSIFFNLHNQRGWEIHQSYFDAFSEKILFRCNWAIFGLKMTYPHNYRSALLIFCKFCRMKRAKRYIKIVLMIFSKKLFIWANWLLWAKKWRISILWAKKWRISITLDLLKGFY